jgi:hypothetical protein
VRAHAHPIWLVTCDLDLKASMVDRPDSEHPDLPLDPEVMAAVESSASLAKAVHTIGEVLAISLSAGQGKPRLLA